MFSPQFRKEAVVSAEDKKDPGTLMSRMAEDQYIEKDSKKWKVKFNELGLPITDIIRDWEHRLCSGMERGKFANYSAKLAEQFQNEIKKTFPSIDLVGLE